jgi:subtilase family serine protease
MRSTLAIRLMVGFLLMLATMSASRARLPDPPIPVLNGSIDEGRLVTLAHNTRPEAVSANDAGRVADGFALPHMMLQLKRSPNREAALETFIAALHDPGSADYHHWLTPAQFAESYGAASADAQKVADWLGAHGFTVHGVQSSGLMIDFSGTAGQVAQTFHTEIHRLNVGGVAHFANMSDPQIPAALAPAIAGVVSLHDFHPKPQLLPRPLYTYTGNFGPVHALVPGDLATIYNLTPAFNAGYTGRGQTIMVVEDTYLYSANDWTRFRNVFGLTSAYPYASLSQVSPAGALTCANPGFQGASGDPGFGDDSEAAIDVEWSSAAAPNAAIVLAACTDTKTVFGGLIALENVLNGPVEDLPSVVSISYGEAEAANGAAANAAYKNAYMQAVAEGVSIFVSAGDEGAASADNGNVATHGIGISGFTSTAYNVSVGGTDFGYTAASVPASTYWSAANTATYNSALSYIQEIPWNDSCAGGVVSAFFGVSPLAVCNSSLVTSVFGLYYHLLFNAVAGSGGPSACATGTAAAPGVVGGSCAGYPKPAWQKVFGNPPDRVRDIPDVSLFASNGFWDAYYVVCWSNPNTAAGGGFNCISPPNTWSGFGGTSLSSPIMAAIQALINEKTGTRWGNPNTVYYQLASTEFGPSGGGAATCNSNTVNKLSTTCIFYDITQGDNDVDCVAGRRPVDCFGGPLAYGVLSTSNGSYQPAYPAGTGWDFATGLGSVNAYNLLQAWPNPP